MDVVTFGEMMGVFNPNRIGPLHFVQSFNRGVGGAEGNVAIGLSRLGKKAGFFSRVGHDPFGQSIIALLQAEGVDTSRIKIDYESPTGIYFKEKRNSSLMNVYYYRKDSAASKMSVKDLDVDYFTHAKWLHITGITPLLSESCERLVLKAIDLAKKNRMNISFDPNIRIKLIKDEKKTIELFNQIIASADLVMPGISEGKFLTREDDPKKVADKLITLGAKNVVIKLGKRGAFYLNNEGYGTVKGIKVEQIVDSVGAGDAFAAGVLAGLLDDLSLEEATEQGNLLGALAVMCEGDVEGLPTKEELAMLRMDQDDISR